MIIFTFIGLIFGIVLGSFTKVLADRSLNYKSFWGRSFCPKCKKTLKWYNLFPLVSYIVQKGKCSFCGKKIGASYPLTELFLGLIVGILFSTSYSRFPGLNDPIPLSIFLADLIFKVFFIVILIALALTDLKKYFIPDRIIIPAIKIALVILTIITAFRVWYLYYFLSLTELGKLLLPPHSDYFQRHALDIIYPLLSGVITGGVVATFFILLIMITRGKGMGGGDVKLGGFIGFCLGFPNGVLAIMLGFIIGAVTSLLLILFGKKKFKEIIPFGPFLVLGALISLFWGDAIMAWYFNLNNI